MPYLEAGYMYLSGQHPGRIVVQMTRPPGGTYLLPETEICDLCKHPDWRLRGARAGPGTTFMVPAESRYPVIPVRISSTGRALTWRLDDTLFVVPITRIHRLLNHQTTLITVDEPIRSVEQLHDAASRQTILEGV